MTEYPSITPSCDRHPDDTAHVLCRRHRELLCYTCGLERASERECSIIEIRKISTERDRLLIENLAVKQLAKDKKHLVERHDTYIESLKSNLEQEVLDVHFKLVQRLDKLKDDCLKSIETQTRTITKSNKQIDQKLALIENTADQNIDKLSCNSTEDITTVKLNTEEVKSDLKDSILNRNARPQGTFKPNTILFNTVLQEDISLGHLTIIEDEACENNERFSKCNTVGNTSDVFKRKQIHGSEISKREVVTRNPKPYERQPCSVQLSSDEVSPDTDDDYLEPISYINTTICYSRSDVKDKDDTTPKQKSDHVTPKERKAKSFSGAPRRYIPISKTVDMPQEKVIIGERKDDPYCLKSFSGYKENIYNDIEFNSLNSITTDKTVTISGMRSHFRSACKFSKLVYLGSSRIGMLSKVHNSIVVVNLNGSVLNTKTKIRGLVNIASVGKEKLALLIENGRQVCILDVSRVGGSTTDCFSVQERFECITGFDFDMHSSLFAISSPSKLVVLDKAGHVVTSHTHSSTPTTSGEIISVYDFRKMRLYVLNIQNRTLKCLDVTKGDAVWKCKYEDGDFIPRNICLYNDTICIACKDVIFQLLSDDGTLLTSHDARSILEDCLGVCVIDDIITFTSNSNDFDISTKLAYRKLV